MSEPKARDCPACNGSGKIYDRDLIGGRPSSCGTCLGFGEVTRDKAEAWLDRQAVTRGEVKRMIADAQRRPKPHHPGRIKR